MEIVRERTERKEAQARAELAEQLRAANDDLERANRELREAQTQLVQSAKMASLGELLAGIAHEVNNPLAYAMSHLATIAESLAAAVPEIRDDLSQNGRAKLEKACRRATDALDGLARVHDLVTKLRTFSRLDEGSFKSVDFRECVESAIPLVRHRLSETIRIETDYADDNRLYCAPGLLDQVVLNLLTNAIDAVGAEGRITVATRREEGWFCVTVADSGAGVPEAILERIFEPFFTTKEVGKGTGMGLAIGYKIVERHHGRIDVGTSAAGGAEFTVRIPADLEERADAA